MSPGRGEFSAGTQDHAPHPKRATIFLAAIVD